MRSPSPLFVAVCLLACARPVLAQQPARLVPAGPISRSVAREAVRLVASGEVAALAASLAQADRSVRPLELRWNELGRLAVGQRVEIPLPDGRVVKGEAVAVRDDVILVDASTKPKGSTSIPRSSVTQLTMMRTKGSGGRTAGTILGVIGGMYLGGAVVFHMSDSGGAAGYAFLGITTAVTMGGYHLGKQADTQTTRITIVP